MMKLESPVLRTALTMAFTLSLVVLSACATQQGSEGEAFDEAPPLDAATDSVPEDPAAPPAEDAPPAPEVADASATEAPPVPEPAPDSPPAADSLAPDTALTPPAMPESTPPVAATHSEPAAPSPAPAASASLSGETMQYTVQAGDTLMKIAFETYGDLYKWKDIYEANKEKLPTGNSIPAGTILTLEKPATPVSIERNGEKYLIKMGDTLGTISNDVYGTNAKWRKLWENNRQMIRDPNRIFAGFYLYYVPDPNFQPQQQVTPAPLADAGTSASAEAPAAGAADGRAPSSAGAAADLGALQQQFGQPQ